MYPDKLKATNENNWRTALKKTSNQYRNEIQDMMVNANKEITDESEYAQKKKLLMVVMVLNQLNQMEKEKETILVINGKDMEHYMDI